MMTQVLIVEPNPYFAIQLGQIIEQNSDQKLGQDCLNFPELRLVGTESSLVSLLETIDQQQPDIVVLDQALLGNVFQAAQQIRDRSATIKILILGVDPEQAGIAQALSVGANGYLLRETPALEILKALQGASKGYFQAAPFASNHPSSQSLQPLQKLRDRSPNPISANLEAQPIVQTEENNRIDSGLEIAPIAEIQKVQTSFSELEKSRSIETLQPAFDRPVILKPTPLWWRLLAWSLLGLTAGLLTWANIYEIEEAIPAQGQLEPEGAVREVQAPIAGVVQTLNVKEGQTVKKGEVLLRLDRKVNQSQLTALKLIRNKLVLENLFYQSQLKEYSPLDTFPAAIPVQMLSLTRSRQTLLAENAYLRTQIQGQPGTNLSADQRLRLQTSRQEEASRLKGVQFSIENLEKQLQQAEIQLTSTQEILSVNQGILADIKPVQQEGAISKVQYLRQYQEVQKGEAEVKRFLEEKKRITAQISEVKSEISTIKSANLKDLTAMLATNEQKIADIDSQLTKSILENQKQIEDIDNRINRTKSDLLHQEIYAPVSGVIFDIKPKSSGFVTNVSETLLKIVPSEFLLAKVYITNQDIGFVKSQMPVDIRIYAYPFSEFGDLKGQITWIGSDVLPPTEVRRFYSFPAKVKLDQQSLMSNGRKLPLQSGMAVSVNIKIRKRPIISIFTEVFIKEIDKLKYIR